MHVCLYRRVIHIYMSMHVFKCVCVCVSIYAQMINSYYVNMFVGLLFAVCYVSRDIDILNIVTCVNYRYKYMRYIIDK